MHAYYTRLHMSSFTVAADFAIDGKSCFMPTAKRSFT
jgi:hypothetical protein